MRLQSFLSKAGIASRRNVHEALEAGEVKVNGEVVRIPSYPIFPDKDRVTHLDRELSLSSKKLLYYIFHKPRGVITTAKDTHGRKTVLDYFKEVGERLYPVGRLDQDTTGLLILTNDGDLAHRLTHPRFGVEKIYEAVLDREMTREEVEQLERGVVIDGEMTAPSKIKILSVRNGRSKAEIMLREGKKRQIRLMFQSIGSRVLHLHRKRYGPLNLKGLPPGKSRLLSESEIDALRLSGSRADVNVSVIAGQHPRRGRSSPQRFGESVRTNTPLADKPSVGDRHSRLLRQRTDSSDFRRRRPRNDS